MIGWRNRPRTDYIVVHSSNTHPDQKDTEGNPIDFRYLDRKHRESGAFMCGYHWIILRDGAVVSMRPQIAPGNHCPGVNQISVAICMIGGANTDGKPESNYTRDQWASLNQLVDALTRQYPEAEVVGHMDVADRKTFCPSFDVRHWYANKKHREKQNDAKSEESNPGTPEVH